MKSPNNVKEWFVWNWHHEPETFALWLFGPFVTLVAMWFLPRTLPLYLLGSALLWLLGAGFYIRLSIWRDRYLVADPEAVQ